MAISLRRRLRQGRRRRLPAGEGAPHRGGLIDAYDAAMVERRDDGKTKIVKNHETPTRAGGVLGGEMGLATGLVVDSSHSQRSAADCCWARPPEARSSARSPVTR